MFLSLETELTQKLKLILRIFFSFYLNIISFNLPVMDLIATAGRTWLGGPAMFSYLTLHRDLYFFKPKTVFWKICE